MDNEELFKMLFPPLCETNSYYEKSIAAGDEEDSSFIYNVLLLFEITTLKVVNGNMVGIANTKIDELLNDVEETLNIYIENNEFPIADYFKKTYGSNLISLY